MNSIVLDTEFEIPKASPVGLNFSKLIEPFTGYGYAMDLGTANTLIYAKNRGIMVNEPSVVAIEKNSGKVIASGRKAKDMFGKTADSIKCIRPMKDGVISDFEMTTLMIQHMLRNAAQRWSLTKPRIVIGVPSGITQVEKKAVIDAALSSGLREVHLMEEPMAAALGSGLPVNQAVGNMIVDIGGGTTEVAVISVNETIYSHSIRVAGDEMDEAIQRQVQKIYGLQICLQEAERIKTLAGSALPEGRQKNVTACGRDLNTGRPCKMEISESKLREALNEPITAIISSVITALEQTSSNIARDIMRRGVYLAGGGSLLKGLGERLRRETGVQFHLTKDPLSCVVQGVGKVIDNYRDLGTLCIN